MKLLFTWKCGALKRVDNIFIFAIMPTYSRVQNMARSIACELRLANFRWKGINLEIRYSSNVENIAWEEIVNLFNAIGWAPRLPNEIEKAFRESTYVRIAYSGNKIVGFGRTVDDGRYYALIADLVVDPEYQGMGIGTQILKELKDALKGYIFTSLIAAPGKDGFYVQHGWLRQKSAFMWPRSKKQEEEYAICDEQRPNKER